MSPLVEVDAAERTAGGDVDGRAGVLIFRGALVVFALRVVALGAQILTASWGWFVGRLPDDAYYYFEIARRIADGDGSTFDGINRTNGFHPLWQALLTGPAFLFEGTAYVRAALLLQLVVISSGLLIVVFVVRRRSGPVPAAGGLLLVCSPWLLEHRLDGMEHAATVLALALVLLAVERFERAGGSVRTAAVLGLACGVAALARLDFLPALVIVFGAAAILGRWSIRQIGAWVGVLVATVVPYFAWNLLAFGHLLSVSGGIKLRWMAWSADSRWGGRLSLGYVQFVAEEAARYAGRTIRAANPLDRESVPLAVVGAVVVYGLLAVAVIWGAGRLRDHWRRGRDPARQEQVARHGSARGRGPLERARRWWSLRRPVDRGLIVVSALLVVHAAVVFATLPRWAGSWYLGAEQLFAVMAIGVVAGAAVARVLPSCIGVRPALAVGGLLALAAILPWPSFVASRDAEPDRNSWGAAMDAAASWLEDHRPAGRWGAYDAGMLGFRSHPHGVVNLDGLVNDYEYDELNAQPQDPLVQYRDQGIDVVINRMSPDLPRRPACARLLWEAPDLIAFSDAGEAERHAPMQVIDVRPCG